MPKRALITLAVAITMCGACGNPANQDVDSETRETTAGKTSATVYELDPEDSTILRRPFTAEQIRAEMVVGLRLMVRETHTDGSTVKLWTVVQADETGVEIEYSTLDENQEVVGEKSVQRADWTELRDHASFPAATSSREWVTRDTDLGVHEGWLYTVAGDEPGVVNEFFFASDLAGAPVSMRIVRDGVEVYSMEQFVRMRPLTP